MFREEHDVGRKPLVEAPYRPVRDDIISIIAFSTHIKSLRDLKFMIKNSIEKISFFTSNGVTYR